eukprot:scaffold19840_cov91-Cylindrotheca_fusiformis.AAC.1
MGITPYINVGPIAGVRKSNRRNLRVFAKARATMRIERCVENVDTALRKLQQTPRNEQKRRP